MPLLTSRRDLAEGYGLTTAQIIYRIPDHPQVLQDFLWQQYDVFPEFPTLQKFLRFWQDKIEGKLHSVTVGHAKLLQPVELLSLGKSLN